MNAYHAQPATPDHDAMILRASHTDGPCRVARHPTPAINYSKYTASRELTPGIHTDHPDMRLAQAVEA